MDGRLDTNFFLDIDIELLTIRTIEINVDSLTFAFLLSTSAYSGIVPTYFGLL